MSEVPSSITSSGSSSTPSSRKNISESLDFALVLKAAQTISSTIEIHELLQQLSQIILQNSGADKCVLILPQDEVWQVRAIAATTKATELCCEALKDSLHIPLKLIQYVKRTQSVVAIDNLETDLPVIDDYFTQHQPKGVLGLPIINQGNLEGIIYLENRSTAGVFTSDRLTVINFLCTQAAISIANANLYQRSQNYSQQLEQSLQQQEILFTVVTNMRQSLDLPTIFGSVTQEICSVLKADRVIVYRFDLNSTYNNGEVVAETVLPAFPASLGAKVQDHCFGMSYANLYSQGRIHTMSDLNAMDYEDCYREILEQFQVKACLIAPIMQNKLLWGLLCIHQCSAPRYWNSSESQFAQRVSVQLSVALTQADMLEQTHLQTIELEESIQRLQDTQNQLQTTKEFIQLVIDSMPLVVFWKDAASNYLGGNRLFLEAAGASSFQEIVGKTDYDLPWKKEESDKYRANDRRIMDSGVPELGIIATQQQASGKQIWLEINKVPLRNSQGEVVGILGTFADITDRKLAETTINQKTQELAQALEELQQTQLQMIQSEKMSALGNLVAGVAHEINNPVGFLNGNIQPALDYINDLFGLIDLVQAKYPQLDPEILEEIETIDLDYIREDLPKLISSMTEGVKRIKEISTSLRTFSRADTDRPVTCNIHEGIDSTIMILKHRLKATEIHPEIQIIKDYGDLPNIECYAGQLNQVFMNLLSNAIDALEESNHGRSYQEIINQITIKTELSEDRKQVIIRFKDNGIGMNEAVQEKIFDDSFTTKCVGKGTGLGLAIARQIIEEKHQGAIAVSSNLGQGTEFTISISY
jgi:PAS domain S-box-containing protein